MVRSVVYVLIAASLTLLASSAFGPVPCPCGCCPRPDCTQSDEERGCSGTCSITQAPDIALETPYVPASPTPVDEVPRAVRGTTPERAGMETVAPAMNPPPAAVPLFLLDCALLR